MKYPKVLSEDDTLQAALAGASLSRFGDGELRLAVGGNCISQRENSPELMAELRAILAGPAAGDCLVCIPNALAKTPKAESWGNYRGEKYVSLYGPQRYGSSFITRPDSAPWIDRPDYWQGVRSLWAGKAVTLVTGGHNGLKAADLERDGAKVRLVEAPDKNAYSAIEKLLKAVPARTKTVVLCVGVTATCMAHRLAQRGHQALDLGHIGMFMKHAGAYRHQAADLASPHYRDQLVRMHKTTKWGGDGAKHADRVRETLKLLPEKATILDYGCGRGELAKALAVDGLRVSEYDPGIPGKDALPKPCDLVVCTDVLEHVEPAKVETVLDHIARLTGRLALLVIATRKANATLPDGRNAHLTVLPPERWLALLKASGLEVIWGETRPDRDLTVVVKPVETAGRR